MHSSGIYSDFFFFLNRTEGKFEYLGVPVRFRYDADFPDTEDSLRFAHKKDSACNSQDYTRTRNMVMMCFEAQA